MNRNTLLVALAVLPLAAACRSSPRVVRVDFVPSPAVVHVTPAGAAEPVARALVTVIGSGRFGGLPDGDHEFHLRLRLENVGQQTIRVEPRRMVLVAADLEAFEAPRLESVARDGDGRRRPLSGGSAGVEVPPGGIEVLELFFPLPDRKRPREMDLDGLNLRFTLLVGEQAVLSGASFQRSMRTPYPYGDSSVRVQVGYTSIDRSGWR